jgi:glutaminase
MAAPPHLLLTDGVNGSGLGVAFCSIDGQQGSMGDATTLFCVQSCRCASDVGGAGPHVRLTGICTRVRLVLSKPITYCIALEMHGPEVVHRSVGREPSGRNFNELILDHNNRPHNPLINSGAIACVSLILPERSLADVRHHRPPHGPPSLILAGHRGI